MLLPFITLWARGRDRVLQSPDTGVVYYYIAGEWHCPEVVASL
jgi:hypothetical protein